VLIVSAIVSIRGRGWSPALGAALAVAGLNTQAMTSQRGLIVSEVVPFLRKTYCAASFEVCYGNGKFRMSGTLCGFIDFATPNSGTYPLSMGEAKLMVAALLGAINDVEANCLHERDPLLLP
jgi:hypothetical protein